MQTQQIHPIPQAQKSKTWEPADVEKLYCTSFLTLIFKAQAIHQDFFDPNEMELCTLLSIKTGACPEDCAYCPQSGHHNTGLKKQSLLNLHDILPQATAAKKNGAVRYCMGAAWRTPPEKDFPKIIEIIKAVKALGLETCMTLGMLNQTQAEQLKQAGLDFYNHNLDTSPEYYQKIISTRDYQDRLETLGYIRKAGIKTCCGGIIGMGESRQDRIELLCQLANLPQQPDSVPINRLMAVQGTPLENVIQIDNFEFIKTVAIARIMMPRSVVRLSAGRESMSEEMQVLCFMAGANSIFFGDKLLTNPNPSTDQDLLLLKKLGMKAKTC